MFDLKKLQKTVERKKALFLFNCLLHVRPSDIAIYSWSDMSLGVSIMSNSRPLLQAITFVL